MGSDHFDPIEDGIIEDPYGYPPDGSCNAALGSPREFTFDRATGEARERLFDPAANISAAARYLKQRGVTAKNWERYVEREGHNNEEENMAERTRNPHDRRTGPRMRNAMNAADAGEVDVELGVPDLLYDGRRAYAGFTVARLEELLRDEFARGFNTGEGTFEYRYEEELLPRARREAWDAGYAAGEMDGVFAYWERVEAGLLTRMAAMVDGLDEELDVDPKRQTKAKLREVVDACRREVAENMRGLFNGPLHPDHVQTMLKREREGGGG